MEMQLIIPTRQRTNSQLTVASFNTELKKHTTIVCPQREVFALSGHSEYLRVEAQPDPDCTIAQKRRWIMEEWHRRGIEKIMMLDDDYFATTVSR